MINGRIRVQEKRSEWVDNSEMKGHTGFWKDGTLDADCLAHLDIKTA